MSIKLMTWVWENSHYEGKKLLLHLAMADHANDEGYFYAGQKRLSQRARCTPEHIRLVVKEMVEDGYLIIERKGNTSKHATQYRLTNPETLKEKPNYHKDLDADFQRWAESKEKLSQKAKAQTPNDLGSEIADSPNPTAPLPKSAWGQPLRTFNIKDNADKSATPKVKSKMQQLVALYFDNLEGAPVKPSGKQIAGQIQLALRETDVEYLEILIPMVAKAGLPLTPNTLMITAREQSKTVEDIQRAAAAKKAEKARSEALDREAEEMAARAVPPPPEIYALRQKLALASHNLTE